MKKQTIKVNTGKDLINSDIVKFDVVNGAWIGELIQKNEEYILLVKDYGNNLVRKMKITEESELDLLVEVLKTKEKPKLKKNIIPNAYVKVYTNDRARLMPLEDYLDSRSYSIGFDNYEELKEAGYSISIPALYDKEGNVLSEEEANVVKEFYW